MLVVGIVSEGNCLSPHHEAASKMADYLSLPAKLAGLLPHQAQAGLQPKPLWDVLDGLGAQQAVEGVLPC